MFSTGSLPLKTAAKSQDAAGFTLIEITMALILLGILGAVAVPKYFDMQEQADAKVCAHNRGVILSSLQTQYAMSKMDESEFKPADAVDTVMLDVSHGKCSVSTPCPELCPEQSDGKGSYYAYGTEDGLFAVFCSIHSPGGSVVTADDTGRFLNWIKDYYTTPITNVNRENAYDTDKMSTLGDYFTYKQDGHIDSDGGVGVDRDGINDQLVKGGYNSMAAIVNASLASLTPPVDTSSIIWSLTRNGGCTDPEHGCYYKGSYTLTVLDKTSDLAAGQEVTAKSYNVTFAYGKDEGNGSMASVKLTVDSSVKPQTVVVQQMNGVDGNPHFYLEAR